MPEVIEKYDKSGVITKTTRKAVKNPFAKVHQAAVESGGNLSDETRKRMMKEAVHELRNNIQTVYDTERS